MEKYKDSVAVLITCHNRRETTLRCLDHLDAQKLEHYHITVYLVDDGSTDGTADAVSKRYPEVRIISGDGTLYWTGGMRKAMNAAMEEGYDFYVWLNDDTMINKNALRGLFDTYNKLKKQEGSSPIVVGNLQSHEKDNTSYGGYVRCSIWHPFRFERLKAGESPKRCDVFNGNLVLLSSEVVDKVGNLHPELRHAKGDFEYGLRAAKKGVQAWIAPGYFGVCSRNDDSGTWKDPTLHLTTRYKKMLSEKGEPLYERYVYISTHGGVLWPILYIAVYLRPLWSHITRLVKE